MIQSGRHFKFDDIVQELVRKGIATHLQCCGMPRREAYIIKHQWKSATCVCVFSRYPWHDNVMHTRCMRSTWVTQMEGRLCMKRLNDRPSIHIHIELQLRSHDRGRNFVLRCRRVGARCGCWYRRCCCPHRDITLSWLPFPFGRSTKDMRGLVSRFVAAVMNGALFDFLGLIKIMLDNCLLGLPLCFRIVNLRQKMSRDSLLSSWRDTSQWSIGADTIITDTSLDGVLHDA
jgi:hypothetical protein